MKNIMSKSKKMYNRLIIIKVLVIMLVSFLPYKIVFAETISIPNNKAGLIFTYTTAIKPGDVLFAKITFQNQIKKEAFLAKNSNQLYAELYFLDAKKTQRASFFQLNALNYLVMLPMPLEITPKQYSIDVLIGKNKTIRLSFPVLLVEPHFKSETIPLNKKNTALKQMNTKRSKEIKELFALLNTTNYTSLFQNKLFITPTDEKRRSSFFADKRIYVYNTGEKSYGYHYGIDFPIPIGSRLIASGSGKVVLAKERITSGLSVVIEHLPGLYSLYYHLSEITVSVGEQVSMGQTIGFSGDTGLATGPHLHWEMRLLGMAVNPDVFTDNENTPFFEYQN